MNLNFLPITPDDLAQYKRDMQEAFQFGAIEGGFPDEGEILPEKDIDRSLNKKGAAAYKAVLDGKIVGGAIVVIDEEKGEGELDFLYVKHGVQSKGIGKFMWYEIERIYPEIKVWKTCTPYFELRNIHFYVNVCKFHIVEFFNERHKDPNQEEYNLETTAPEGYFDGMFEFEKVIK